MFVIKCKSDDKENFLTREGHLTILSDATRYPSRVEALVDVLTQGLESVAKVRRFIPAKKAG
jgi:hypothetical protein